MYSTKQALPLPPISIAIILFLILSIIHGHYQTEGTTDPELKDLMKMTNDKLEILVTELKSVVNLLENRVTYNDPIQPIQHSLLPVEHDEKQYKPNECDSKTLEVTH